MTVHFIGAGPGDPDLLTLRAVRVMKRCPVCLYAGSLVPAAVLSHLPADARMLDTSDMTLDEIIGEMLKAHERGQDVARLHSGDPSIYGAIAEQMRRLARAGVPCEIVPGVPAFAAAAASLRSELTLPGVAQSVILTRMPGQASPMPEAEDLVHFARSGATLVLHLSIRRLREIRRKLLPVLGGTCPVAVAYRVGWPDELLIRGTLADIEDKVRKHRITRTALIIIGRVLDTEKFGNSALYDADFHHILRPPRRS